MVILAVEEGGGIDEHCALLPPALARVVTRAIFRCFNKERDGALSREQYLLRQRLSRHLYLLLVGVFALFALL